MRSPRPTVTETSRPSILASMASAHGPCIGSRAARKEVLAEEVEEGVRSADGVGVGAGAEETGGATAMSCGSRVHPTTKNSVNQIATDIPRRPERTGSLLTFFPS